MSAPLVFLIAATFHGYPCTQDCSGHEAGYEWAEENDITDSDDCDGNSQSFIEGCIAWTEEQGERDDSVLIEDGECEDDDEDGYCDED